MTRRLFQVALCALVGYWLTIFVLTHLPPKDLPHVKLNDKIEHLMAYYLLSVLLNLVLHRRWSRHADWLTLILVLAYGAADEITQPLTGRTCDFLDWLADGTGAALGIIAYGAFQRIFLRSCVTTSSPVSSDKP